MKKFRIGKYYYTKNEIAILTIIKWIIELCKLAVGSIIAIIIMLTPFYIVALMEKSILLTTIIFIIDIICIGKMLVCGE